MLDAFMALELGKKLAVSQYREIEADAFLRGYLVALAQVAVKGNAIEDCVRLPAEAASIIKSAQQGVQRTATPSAKTKRSGTSRRR